MAQSLLVGTTALGAFAGVKAMKGIWDLATAGTSLKEAAAALKGAATTMKSGKDSTTVATDGKNSSTDLFGGAGKLTTLLNFWATLTDKPSTPEEWESNRKLVAKRDKVMNKWLEDNNLSPLLWFGGNRQGDVSSGSPDDRDERKRAAVNPYDAATDEMRRRQAFEADTGTRGNTPGLGDVFKPQGNSDDVNTEQPAATVEKSSPEKRTAHAYQQNAETRQAAGVSSNPHLTPRRRHVVSQRCGIRSRRRGQAYPASPIGDGNATGQQCPTCRNSEAGQRDPDRAVGYRRHGAAGQLLGLPQPEPQIYRPRSDTIESA